jgi:hypothetical protein
LYKQDYVQQTEKGVLIELGCTDYTENRFYIMLTYWKEFDE